MINEELIWKVVDRIEQRPQTYDQRVPRSLDDGTSTCHAPCCFFGHTVLLHDGSFGHPMESTFNKGMEYLGLRYVEATILFNRDFGVKEIGERVTPTTLRQTIGVFLEKIKKDRNE